MEEESHLLSGECPVYGDMVAMVDDQLVAFFDGGAAQQTCGSQAGY